MSKKFKFNRNYLLIYLSVAVDPLVVSSYNPLVPVLKTAFNVNIELVALSLTFHMLPFALLNLFSGTMSDLYYRPRILMFGLILSTVGSSLGALSPDISIFLLSRTIQGIGSALIMPITLAMLGDITPREVLGRVIGIYGIFLGFAVTLGPLLGGFLAFLDWRLVPLLLSVYTLIQAVLVRKVFKVNTTRLKKGNLSLVLQQFRHLRGNKNIFLLSIAGFFLFFTYQGIQPFISDQLSLPPLDMKEEEIGAIFSIAGLTGIVFSLLGGLMIDRVGSKKTMTLGFLTMIFPQLLLVFTNSYWGYLILMPLLNGFQRLSFNSVRALVIESTPDARGSAASIFNFISYLGFASAPALLYPVYSAHGINIPFTLNIILFLVGVFFSILIKTDRPDSK